MPRNEQVVRQWKLLRRLERSTAGIAAKEIAGSDQAARRCFYRDMEALQGAGFPIYNEQVDGESRWILTESFRRTMSVPVTPSAAISLQYALGALERLADTPLRVALQEHIERVQSAMTPQMRRFANSVGQAVASSRFGRPHWDSASRALEALTECCQSRLSVDIAYRSLRGELTERRVDPYVIWMHAGLPYLIGWCHRRHAIRTFSTWRIQSVTQADHSFEPQEGFDVDTFVHRHFRVYSDGKSEAVRIWFAPELAVYIGERTWHPSQALKAADDGGVVLTMQVDGLTEIASWVLSFGARARALAPPELVSRLQQETEAMATAYLRDAQPRPAANVQTAASAKDAGNKQVGA